MAINWRNVNAPNNTGNLQLQAQSGQGIANAFTNLGQVLTDVQGRRVDTATDAAIANLRSNADYQPTNELVDQGLFNQAVAANDAVNQRQANVDSTNLFRQNQLDATAAQNALTNTRADENLQLNRDRFDLETVRAEDKRNADFIKAGQDAAIAEAKLQGLASDATDKRNTSYNFGQDGRPAGTYSGSGKLIKPDAKQNKVLREAQNSLDRNNTTTTLINEALQLGSFDEQGNPDTSTGRAISGAIDARLPTFGARQQRLESVLEGLETQASLINSEFTKGAISDVEFKAFGEAFGKLKDPNVRWETKVKSLETLQGLVGKANDSANFTLTGKRPERQAAPSTNSGPSVNSLTGQPTNYSNLWN